MGREEEGGGQMWEDSYPGTGVSLSSRAPARAAPKPGQREQGLVIPEDEQGADRGVGWQAVLGSHTLGPVLLSLPTFLTPVPSSAPGL